MARIAALIAGVEADLIEIRVKDHTGATFFPTAANFDAAVVIAAARGELALDMRRHGQLDVTVEITAGGAANNLFMAVRSSSKPTPDLATATDWQIMNRTANIDTATGIDSTRPLREDIVLTTAKTGRYTISLPVTARFASVVVWLDTADAKGNVYMYRRP